ncbi:MAG: hypothetical protein JWO62_1007 [Acidimicrobiaceae bacterium]|nr:hypothetical protein [Acidimicrobiaceae bacterium]
MTAGSTQREDNRQAGARTRSADPHATLLPSLVDIETVAGALGVGVRHVRRLVAERRIPYVKVGHYVRFEPDVIARWVEERRVAGHESGPIWVSGRLT